MGNSLSPLQKEAPQLTKYFKHQAKFHKDVAGMVGNPMELMTNPAKAQKLAEKMQRMRKALDDKLTVKARKSFKHHDVDDSGELDEAESQIFFEHYTRLCVSLSSRDTPVLGGRPCARCAARPRSRLQKNCVWSGCT